MKNLKIAITDFELEDMEDSLSSLINKVIELLNKEEINSNEEVKKNLEVMYERLSEANEVFGNFEYILEKEER